MELFSDYMRHQFEGRMTHHLRARFPDETRAFDEHSLHEVVIWGIRRAEGYGIDFEDDIRRYLEYMMVLSRDFDTNLQTAWAGDILRRRDVDGARKMTEIDNVYLFART
jgi:hypothetical protein